MKSLSLCSLNHTILVGIEVEQIVKLSTVGPVGKKKKTAVDEL